MLAYPLTCKLKIIALILNLFLLVFASSAMAELVLENKPRYELVPHMHWLNSEKGLSIEQVKTLPLEQWRQPTDASLSLGIISHEHWIKFEILNKSKHTNWIWVLGNNSINQLKIFYEIDDKIVDTRNIGNYITFTEGRDIPIYDLNLELNVPTDSKLRIYIRVDHRGYFDLPSRVKTSEEFYSDSFPKISQNLIFLGIYVSLLLYHLLLFIATKDLTYLYYSFFISGISIVLSYVDGAAFSIFWRDSPEINRWVLPTLIPTIVISASLFTLKFLNLRSGSKHIAYRVLIGFISLGVTLLVASPFLQRYITELIGYPLLVAVYLSIPILSLQLAYVKRSKLSQIYAYSWGLWSIFAGILVASLLGLLPIEVSGLWFWIRIAFIVQMFSLAWALAYRIQNLKLEREKAKADSQAKSDLLAKVSHEIRTPMNGILGMSEILKDIITDPIGKKYNSIITQSGKALLNVVNDLLDFSRMNAGKIQIQPSPTEIHKLLSNVWSLMQNQILAKNIRAHSSIDKNIPDCLNIDETRLRQVLLNLLSNALKFTETGQILFEARWLDNCLVIIIEDSGRGISESDIERIFSPFEQVISNEDEQRTGTGLGLPITKELIELMQGDFSFDSKLNVGTKCSITLPAQLCELPPIENTEPDSNISLNILVAEDNNTNQIVIEKLLEKAGNTFVVTANGQACFEYYQNNYTSIDVILMDCEMPVLDGYRASKKIREWESKNDLPQCPIIAVTAHAYDGHLSKVVQAGMNSQICKPLQLKKLANALHSAFLTARVK